MFGCLFFLVTASSTLSLYRLVRLSMASSTLFPRRGGLTEFPLPASSIVKGLSPSSILYSASVGLSRPSQVERPLVIERMV